MGMYCGLYKLPSAGADDLLKDSTPVVNLLNTEPSDGSYLSLEKAWHGLHYLLTGSAHAAGSSPLSFILTGGREIGPDVGYGPARLLQKERVRELDASLRELTIDDLWARFDPERMSADQVYPDIWDEPEEELKEEYGWYFDELKSFVSNASDSGDALVIAIT